MHTFGVLLLILILVASMWRINEKAGQPGYVALIPFYGLYVLLKLIGKPWWWMILYFVPVVNVAISAATLVALCERFGKGLGFSIFTVCLSVIGIPLLAFGESRYTPPPQEIMPSSSLERIAFVVILLAGAGWAYMKYTMRKNMQQLISDGQKSAALSERMIKQSLSQFPRIPAPAQPFDSARRVEQVRPYIPGLLSDFASGDPDRRLAAAVDLVNLEVTLPAETIPPLITMLSDSSLLMRRTAARALALNGTNLPESANAIPALQQLLNDPDKEVQESARYALGRINPMGSAAYPAATRP